VRQGDVVGGFGVAGIGDHVDAVEGEVQGEGESRAVAAERIGPPGDGKDGFMDFGGCRHGVDPGRISHCYPPG
jgi:hypothetical protein